MSVRAYRRITEPKTADRATFNCGHPVMDALLALETTWDGISPNGGGGFEVMISELEEFLATTKMTLEPEIKKALLDDLTASKKQGKEYIYYECY